MNWDGLVVNRRVPRQKSDTRPRLYIGRGSRWGNPYRVGSTKNGVQMGMSREEVLDKYTRDVWKMSTKGREIWLQPLLQHVRSGGVLECWCAPLPCHGDILVAWLQLLWEREARSSE